MEKTGWLKDPKEPGWWSAGAARDPSIRPDAPKETDPIKPRIGIAKSGD